jgi:epoxyqueuosine reductase
MTAPDPAARREEIRRWGMELGFERVGFAPAERAEAGRARLLEWLARGYQAEMAWLARDPERRIDPTVLLPGCRAVIVAALQYHRPEPGPAAPGLPRISQYAQGDDYHEVLGEKLRGLAERIRAGHPGLRFRIACDTSPVLEKAFAVRGGLGWLGKNTCVLHPRLGSWFFIGELFVDLFLPADPEIGDLCGTCTRCVDACPTGAFPEPYVLDANRCIGDWNVEHRGELRPGWAEAMGDWLVGCDICQEVCPWNRKAPSSREPRFAPRRDLVECPAERWLAMSDEEYRGKVRGTAICRVKPPEMRRNAAVVRANRARAEDVAGRAGRINAARSPGPASPSMPPSKSPPGTDTSAAGDTRRSAASARRRSNGRGR